MPDVLKDDIHYCKEANWTETENLNVWTKSLWKLQTSLFIAVDKAKNISVSHMHYIAHIANVNKTSSHISINVVTLFVTLKFFST